MKTKWLNLIIGILIILFLSCDGNIIDPSADGLPSEITISGAINIDLGSNPSGNVTIQLRDSVDMFAIPLKSNSKSYSSGTPVYYEFLNIKPGNYYITAEASDVLGKYSSNLYFFSSDTDNVDINIISILLSGTISLEDSCGSSGTLTVKLFDSTTADFAAESGLQYEEISYSAENAELSYSFDNIQSGDYIIYATNDTYNNQNSSTLVTFDSTTSGIDFTVGVARSITGSISIGTDWPDIGTVTITLFNSDDMPIETLSTSYNFSRITIFRRIKYTFSNIPLGSYFVLAYIDLYPRTNPGYDSGVDPFGRYPTTPSVITINNDNSNTDWNISIENPGPIKPPTFP